MPRLPFGKWFARRKPAIRNETISGLSLDEFVRLFLTDSPGSNVTAQNAIEAIPVQACVSLIAGGILSMPVRIVEREFTGGEMTQRPADDHAYWWLFNEQTEPDSPAAFFWEQIVERKLLWGRAFARIIRKNGGRSSEVTELLFTPNENVTVDLAWDPVDRRRRITRYLVRDGQFTYGVLPEDMLDFRGQASGATLPVYGTANAYPAMSSIIRSAREAISICLTVEQYCAKFFGNGGMPRTVLQYPAGVTLDEKQVQMIRDAWVKKYGGTDNAGLPLVLANGGTAQKLTFNAEEAQMLEARKFQVIEIARAFGVPPFMIGDVEKTSAWGTGIEQMSQGFIRYTIGPHVTAIEQELNRKLFKIQRYFATFDKEALSRGDMKAVGEWFRQVIGGAQGPGIMSANEVRRRLNLAPKPGADELYDPKGTPDGSAKPPDGASGSEPDDTAAE